MTTLSESIVLSRSRADDLHSVKKLNCWGSELGDVALLRDMKSVEVLSLSVNKIKTLADFAYCPKLQELYIRKNEIQDLSDVLYLTDLKQLRSLWLADNPCADVDNYRLTVIKYLPNLQKLDNIVVKPEEVQSSLLYGGSLALRKPNSGVQNEGTAPSPPPRHQSPKKQEDAVCPSSPPKLRSDQVPRQACESELLRDENRNISNKSVQRIPQSESMSSLDASDQKMPYSSYSPSYQAQQLSSPVQPPFESPYGADDGKQPQAFQARVQTLVEHSRTPGHQQAHVEQNQGSLNPLESASLPSHHQSFDTIVHTCNEHGSSLAENGHRHSVNLPTGHSGAHIGMPRSHSSGDRSSPTRAFTGRGKNRNSNILSAVLCLIKELDYASLEVVETAVQCRMLELEDYISP